MTSVAAGTTRGQTTGGAAVAPMSRGETARAAVSLLRRRSWALALVGVVVLSVCFVFLGRWQMSRHDAKVERRNLIAANYDAAPVPLADLVPPTAAGGDVQPGTRQAGTFDRALEWRPVTVRGTYAAQHTILVRNRPFEGVNGYEVLVPLRTDDGRVLLVDQGWIVAGADASRPDSVPSPPQGPVEVVARLRPGEPPTDRRPPAGQALRIDLDQIGETLQDAGVSQPLVPAYAVLATQSPASERAPALLPRPEVGLGINFAYAVQWWAFAVAAYVLFAVATVREVRRERQQQPSPQQPSPQQPSPRQAT